MSNLILATESEWLGHFGNSLKELIDDSGYSQREIADAAGLSEATISRYIKGSVMPTAKAIINLSLVLNTDADYLLLRDWYDKIK